jgi:methionyl-tRNA formyltransferase
MSERPWRVLFFSMALPAIQRLAEFVRAAGHEPVALLTLRPRDDDGARERAAAILAGAPSGVDIVIPASPERLAPLTRAYEPDLVMCVGFNWKIPREVLDIPRLGIVNSHPSLLPRYRGPIPVAWAIRNGDPDLGLTYHRMDEEYDTGAVLAQGSVPIGPDDAFPDLIPKLGGLSAQLLPHVFERLAAGDPGDAQDESVASWAPFFEDDYVWIDWSKPREEIHRQVRAWRLAPARGLAGPLTKLDGETVRVLASSLESVAEARSVDAADGPVWIVETERVDA